MAPDDVTSRDEAMTRALASFDVFVLRHPLAARHELRLPSLFSLLHACSSVLFFVFHRWPHSTCLSIVLISLQMTSSDYYCVPGDRLCPCDRAIAGPGTYEKQNCIYASIAGTIQLTTNETPSTANEKKSTISVVREDRTLAVPSVGSLAYCKVTNVTSRFVRCLIFAINNQPMKTPCHGRITRENIESINKDTVVCSNKFRPGDIVLARMSLHNIDV